MEGPAQSSWDASRAIELWWLDKRRRVKDKWSAPKQLARVASNDEDEDGDDYSFQLENWDRFASDDQRVVKNSFFCFLRLSGDDWEWYD